MITWSLFDQSRKILCHFRVTLTMPQTSVKNCKHSNFTMIGEVNQTIINVRIVAPIQQLQYLHVKNMKSLKDKRLSII